MSDTRLRWTTLEERETAAALAGGYWAVLDMPNTPPSTTSAERLRVKYDFVAARARCDFALYMGADQAADGSEYADGAPDAVGLKMYCDQTTGSLLLEDDDVRRWHLRAWAAATRRPSTSRLPARSPRNSFFESNRARGPDSRGARRCQKH